MAGIGKDSRVLVAPSQGAELEATELEHEEAHFAFEVLAVHHPASLAAASKGGHRASGRRGPADAEGKGQGGTGKGERARRGKGEEGK